MTHDLTRVLETLDAWVSIAPSSGATSSEALGRIIERHEAAGLVVSRTDLRALLREVAALRRQAEDAESAMHKYRAENATLRAKADGLELALVEIANADYRGNRSHESQVAHRALTAYAQARAAQGGTDG